MFGILLSEASGVIDMIGTVGFPIVMCGALFWKMNEQDKRHTATVNELTKVVEANTVALTKLTAKIGGNTNESVD